MCTTKKIVRRRDAFTLVEMLVVIVIILVIAALAAAFAPRVTDNQNLTRAVDNLEQWLLTAKMRAKRDGLATGLRFVQGPGDAAGTYSQFQYIQQPEPLAGGVCVGGPLTPLPPPAYQYPAATGNYYTGGLLTSAIPQPPPPLIPTMEIVTFVGVDFWLGGTPNPNQWLVQPGDYLEINGGGVYIIGQVSPTSPTNTLVLGQPNLGNPPNIANAYVLPPFPSAYDLSLTLGSTATPPTPPITNYRIIRQPRILIGEEPLVLPNNYAANFGVIPGTATSGCNVALGTSGYPEILFSPTGAVVGTNAGNSTLVISVWDTSMDVPDPNRVGIVGIQGRSGFMGAYGVSLSANPFFFVQTARESGL